MIDWFDCKQKRIAKDVTLDSNMISALLDESKNKLASAELLELTNITASSKISLLYDSPHAVLEALALQNGFKIYNHECYTAFLREILKHSELATEFDKLRRIRNQINYYGKGVDIDEAQSIAEDIKTLRMQVSDLL